MIMSHYNDLKAKGAAGVSLVNGTKFLFVKKYDPNTGEALPDEVNPVNMENLEQAIKQIDNQISALEKDKAALSELISDLNEL